MPKLTGVFEGLKGLGDVTADELGRWLSFIVEEHELENFLANRLIYPQTIPMTAQELEIDYAILRAAITLNRTRFYNPSRLIVQIPEDYLLRFPNTNKLIWCFTDALDLKEVTKIVMKKGLGKRVLGSILTYPSLTPVNLTIKNQQFSLPAGSLTKIPLKEKSTQVQLNQTSSVVYGGEAGLCIDLRER